MATQGASPTPSPSYRWPKTLPKPDAREIFGYVELKRQPKLPLASDSLDAAGSTTSTAAMSALANAADKMTLSDKDLEEQTSACVRACFRQRRATGVFFRVNVA